MTFVDFLNKYYPSEQQHEVIFMLNQHGIYQNIETSLYDFYKSVGNRSHTEIVEQLVVTIGEFVSNTQKPLVNNKSEPQSQLMKKHVSDLAIHLIKDTYRLSGLESSTYTDLLTQVIRNTSYKNSWDFLILESLLSFDDFQAPEVSKKAKNNDKKKHSKPLRLDWNGNHPLDFFMDDLIKIFKGVKSKRKLYQLFQNNALDFKIEMPSKYLLSFLNLFYHLHECGTIKVIGNRGLFIFLNRHLQAPPNDLYPQRDFRKLRCESSNNNYSKQKIFTVIKPLLDKYCQQMKADKKMDDNWTIVGH